MGLVHVNVDISNPEAPETSESVRVLVDTGATLSVLPTDLLDRLGVRRIGRQRFRGSGGVVTREVGNVSMRCDGAVAGVTVVFGGDDDPAIMGVTALESLGYELDPVSGRLNRIDLLML